MRAVVGGVDAVADAELDRQLHVGRACSRRWTSCRCRTTRRCKAGVVVYDMVYRPAQTKLMRQVEAAGGRAIGGLGMLVRQGAAAFKLWTGVEPPVDVMFAAAQSELEKRN